MTDHKNIYHRALHLPVEPSEGFVDGIISSWNDPAKRGIIPFDPESHLVDFFENLGLVIAFAEAFYTPPGFRLGIHTDGRDPPSLPNRTKINWIYGARTSPMTWYVPNIPGYEGDNHVTPAGTVSRVFAPPFMDMAFEIAPHSPCLLNVGRPHSVANTTKDPRWCLSYTLGHAGNTRRILQWDDAVRIMGAYVVDG